MNVDAPSSGSLSSQWLSKLEKRIKKLEKSWYTPAKACYSIYECKDANKVPFNILYSNTETLAPALYASTPRPDVSRRYTNESVKPRRLDEAAAQVGQRILEHSLDTNVIGQESFTAATSASVLDVLLAGQGQARVRYHEEETERGVKQYLTYENVPFNRFVWGDANKWASVPWVAFGHELQKADFEAQFPKFKSNAAYAMFKWSSKENQEVDEDRASETTQTSGAAILVWEIWEPATKTVHFVCEDFKDEILHEEPYPTEFTGRFPCPEPLTFLRRTKGLVPIPPYQVYKSQAEMLNTVTRRLERIVDAIRVRGVYDKNITAFEQILSDTALDNGLVGTEQTYTLQQTGGLDKHIWLMPIDMLVKAAAELYLAQNNIKQTIFEMMGIADILRGSSDPRETAKAQDIKNRWGTLRLKKMQGQVQGFCRELLRIAFEFAVDRYTPVTLQSVTQLPYLFQATKEQVQQAQQMAPPAAPGQPPSTPPLPSELQYGLDWPSWEEIQARLRDNFLRSYTIDVQTNSTVDLEATEDKESIGEFMNAFGQMMAGMKTLQEGQMLPPEALKYILLEVVRRYRFGRQIEGALEMLKAPQPQEDPTGKAQMAQQKAQAAAELLHKDEQIADLQAQIRLLEQKQAGELHSVKTDYAAKIQRNTQQTQEAKLTAKVTQIEAQLAKQLGQIQALIQQLAHQQQLTAAHEKVEATPMGGVK